MLATKLLGTAIVLVSTLLINLPASAQGVPKGTVISWIPPKEAIIITDPQNPKIKVPDGWKSCDEATGLDGFKQERFVNGVSVTGYIAHLKNKDALFGGAATHGHSASSGDNNKIVAGIDDGSGKSAADAYHSHPITVSGGPNIPPYVFAILLCKT